jgi:serine/threonine-protein kinase HipA
MIRGNGASLAPMYDVMCGEVWENVTKNLAQKIAGKSRGDHLSGKDWQQFARECGLNPRQVLDRVQSLAKSAIAEARTAASEVTAMPAGTHEALGRTREAVERRANLILAHFHDLGGEPHTVGPCEDAIGLAGAAVQDLQLAPTAETGVGAS